MTQAAALLDYSIIGVIRGRWKPAVRFQKRKSTYTCRLAHLRLLGGKPYMILFDSTLDIVCVVVKRLLAVSI